MRNRESDKEGSVAKRESGGEEEYGSGDGLNRESHRGELGGWFPVLGIWVLMVLYLGELYEYLDRDCVLSLSDLAETKVAYLGGDLVKEADDVTTSLSLLRFQSK